MKNILMRIFKWICVVFCLLGIFGTYLGIVDKDFELFTFYIGWTAIFLFLFFLISKKIKHIKPVEQERNAVRPRQQHKSEAETKPEANSITRKESAPKKELPAFPNLYTVLDLETPNRSNDRISQIGLLVVHNGNILKNYSSLINPECKFDPVNTELTGLTSEKVSRAPSFKQYWPRIKVLFSQCVIVCHNADFDLNVLSKTLKHYGFDLPKIKYVCTFLEAKNKFPELQKHSLPFLAKHFNIPCDVKHNASYDANVCRQFFEFMKKERFDFFVREFEEKKTKQEPFINSSVTIGIPSVNYISDDDEVDIPFSQCPDIEIDGKKFVLTGIFTELTRAELTEYIKENGGRVTSSVSGKTDYLMVGNEFEPRWKHGNYGIKIEKAIELIKSGSSDIQIIREDDFVDEFGLLYQ